MKKLLASSVLAATAVAGFSAPAMADVSANVGFVSDYYFRGANLGDAGMYGGVDYEAGGFYAGTWVIDDGTGGNDGLEYDLYFGYGADVGGVSLYAGYSLYSYTYTGDNEGEFNLGAAVGPFALDIAIGEDNNDDSGDPDFDYEFISLSWSGEVFGATVGRYEADEDGGDFEYNYVELSASAELSGFDFTASIGTQFDAEDASGDINDLDGYMILDVSKTFDL